MTLYTVFAILIFLCLWVVLRPVFKDGNFPKEQRRGFILTVCLLFSSSASALYALTGSPDILPLMAAREEKRTELKKIIIARSNDVKADPNDLKAWIELGDSFMQMEQYPAAANAFKQAVVLTQGDPILILAYAKAQIFEHDGTVTDEAKKGLDMVLLQDPKNDEARYFLAVRELQDGHTQEAMQAMKSLYKTLAPDSQLKAMIDSQIGKSAR